MNEETLRAGNAEGKRLANISEIDFVDEGYLSLKIISRKEAEARGLKRFFTGKVCAHGHLAERYTINRQCYVCAKEALTRHKQKMGAGKLAAYHRQWRKNNKDKCIESSRRYAEKHRVEIRTRAAQKLKNDPEYRARRIYYSRRYRVENIDHLRKYEADRMRKIRDVIAWMREEMPEILKEFGL